MKRPGQSTLAPFFENARVAYERERNDSKLLAKRLETIHNDLWRESESRFINPNGSAQMRTWASMLMGIVKHLDKETYDEWYNGDRYK